MTNAQVVREMRTAFQQQDVGAAERLLADEFRFTSPQDDHLDKAAYLRVCFPTSSHFVEQTLMELVEAGATTVLSRYEYELHDGKATATWRQRRSSTGESPRSRSTSAARSSSGTVRESATPARPRSWEALRLASEHDDHSLRR